MVIPYNQDGLGPINLREGDNKNHGGTQRRGIVERIRSLGEGPPSSLSEGDLRRRLLVLSATGESI